MWRNLVTFSLVLDSATAAARACQATLILSATTALCLLMALFRRKMPDTRVVWAPLFALIVVSSVASLLTLRGRGVPPLLEARPIDVFVRSRRGRTRTGRVTVIAIDGASLDLITSVTAEGRLPNFGRILDAGAVRHLATLRPTSAEAVWAAVATGKLPQKNGSPVVGHLSAGRRERHDATASRLLFRPRAGAIWISRGTGRTRRRRSARGTLVEHPQHRRLHRRRGRLAADAAARRSFAATSSATPIIGPRSPHQDLTIRRQSIRPTLQLEALGGHRASGERSGRPSLAASICSEGTAGVDATGRAGSHRPRLRPHCRRRCRADQAGTGDAHPIPGPRFRSDTISCATRSRLTSAT